LSCCRQDPHGKSKPMANPRHNKALCRSTDQIRPFVPRRYRVLGTDGFGRSDVCGQLRKFFEVNRHYIALAALKALADEGELPASRVAEAIEKYGIDPEKPNPVTL